MEPVTIVGAGPVGTLLAMYLARRGHPITVFERNADVRTHAVGHGSSINLTLCARGLAALDRVGAGDAVRRIGVPVYGRMIHRADGQIQWQPYGNRGEALLSVTRNELTGALLDHAQDHFGLRVQFGQLCTDCDVDPPTVELMDTATGAVRRHEAGWIVSADGAFSAVRAQLERRYGLACTQEFATLAYKQLDVAASPRGWTADREVLHLWPRERYMLLAIPNQDGTFTAALLLPRQGERSHASITTEAQLLHLFEELFPDAIAHIPDLAGRYFASRPVPLVTVSCSPWSYGGRVLLLGDAAHAVFPSYGQGANAGFEDCAGFDALLEEAGGGLADAFERMETVRRPHTDAIAALSRQHLLDLCAALGTAERTLRDRIESKLNQLDASYLPLYSMVSFTDLPYAEAVRRDHDRRAAVDALAALVADRPGWDDPASEALIRTFAYRAGLIAETEAACSPGPR